MALEMKSKCEECAETFLQQAVDAPEIFICSYECTFCSSCTKKMKFICPNCTGELVLRPRRPSRG